MKPKGSKRLLVSIGIFWALIVSVGMGLLMQYEGGAGTAAAAPSNWPGESQLERASNRPTLVVLAHPRCPCTRATIGELERLMAQLDGRLVVYVVFINPEGVAAEWAATDTWSKAAAIPGVKVILDDRGFETELFGTLTSGQAILYDKDGKLVFQGGITIGRGEEGDSMGASAIASLVNGDAPGLNETGVFGCPLFASDLDAPEKEQTR